MAELMGGKLFLRDAHVGKRGQIVIPKDIRDLFGIKPGDYLVLFVDKERGIGIMKQDQAREIAQLLMGGFEGKGAGKKGRK